jgi:hypothetical protein
MEDNKSTSSSARQSQYSRPSPYLLLVYPVILALGSAFSQISPIANAYTQTSSYTPPFDPGLTSGQNTPTNPVQQFNYFAGKRNLFNIYFVKIGWFWTTLAFVLLQLTLQPASSRTKSKGKQNHYVHSLIRYTLTTTSWILVTQWFFGPALVDRSFTLTGGHCEYTTIPQNIAMNDETTAKINKLPTLVSAVACKAKGGHWRGGHDISGHVFMLALSSAFLIYELIISDSHSSHPSISPRAAANISHDMSEEEKKAIGGWESEGVAKLRVYVRYFVYAVVGLDFWMLMMTAIWFHTWLEKLSGLMLAGATLYSVYFLGEFVEGWRGVVGL